MNYKYNKNPAETAYWYAYYGLIHKNRNCPYCMMPMRLIKGSRNFGIAIAWLCVRCKSRKSITSYTPLQFVDIKVFDSAIHLWLDSHSSTIGEKIC